MVTTRVVQFTEFGGPEVLHLADRRLREPVSDEVLVRVRAAGINPVDYRIRQGAKLPDVALPYVGGRELAGTIVEVGPDAQTLTSGDEVFGSIPEGAFADYAVVSSRYFSLRPPEVPVDVAAGLALAGQTAWDALDAMRLGQGDSLFVSAAAGGVGSILVQLARMRGLTVYGSASTRNHAWLTGIGVTPVEYGPALADTLRQVAPQGVSAAIDLAGASTISALLSIGLDPQRINSLATSPEVFGTMRRGRGDTALTTLDSLAARVVEGSLELPIEAEFPFQRACEAFELLEARHVRGKIILVP